MLFGNISMITDHILQYPCVNTYSIVGNPQTIIETTKCLNSASLSRKHEIGTCLEYLYICSL